MAFPRPLVLVFALTTAIVGTAAKPVASEDPTDLRAELLHIGFPIHVETTGGEAGFQADCGKRQTGLTVAPRVKCSSSILKEPVYDVSAYMKHNGAEMPPGSRAIYSPGAELLFLESNESDRKLVLEILSPFPVDEHHIIGLDVVLSSNAGDKPVNLLDMQSVPFRSGQRMELAVGGDASVRLDLEPVMGPDGEHYDMAIEAEIRAGGKSLVTKVSKNEIPLFKPNTDEIALGKLGDAMLSLRIKTHDTVEYVGPPALATPTARTAAIQEIRTGLVKPLGGGSPTVATEPVPKFEADLRYVDVPLHVISDLAAFYSREARKSEPGKATFAPEVFCTSPDLRPPVYDVSATLRSSGLVLPEASRALYSPGARLLYIRSTSDDLERAKVLFMNEFPPSDYTVDVEEIMQSGGHEQRVVTLKSVPLPDGKATRLEIAVESQTIHLSLMPEDGGFEGLREAVLDFDAKIDASGKSAGLIAEAVMSQARPLEIKLGPLGDATATLRMQLHEQANFAGKPFLATPEKRAEVIREIEKSLEAPK